uniref:RING-type domain-containing protein n=1 Tax=Meloidogyne enterolobii TaxID=390850 RepID=A0A6V7Y479_MELEN|nr:unnamed protein product [Meloidogyne enterolobii]
MNEYIRTWFLAISEIKAFCESQVTIIHDIVRYNYWKKMREIIYNEAVKKEIKECPICFNGFNKLEDIQITNCGHFFHWDCIKEWFYWSNTTNHKYCPLRCPQKLQIFMHPAVAQLNDELKRSGIVNVGYEEKYKLVHRGVN